MTRKSIESGVRVLVEMAEGLTSSEKSEQNREPAKVTGIS